jgi:hypothetical protein
MNNEPIKMTESEQRDFCGGYSFEEMITLYKSLRLTGTLKPYMRKCIVDASELSCISERKKALAIHSRLSECETFLGEQMDSLLATLKGNGDGSGRIGFNTSNN